MLVALKADLGAKYFAMRYKELTFICRVTAIWKSSDTWSSDQILRRLSSGSVNMHSWRADQRRNLAISATHFCASLDTLWPFPSLIMIMAYAL